MEEHKLIEVDDEESSMESDEIHYTEEELNMPDEQNE